MSSHQDPYHYPDQSFYYESGSGSPVARQSHSPGPSWIPNVTSSDQSGYSPPHQSLDQVGNLLNAYDAEDINYSYDHGHFNYSPQGTSFQDPGAWTDATYNDNIHLANLPFYPDFDYGQSQLQDSYTLYEPMHEFSGQPSTGDPHATNNLTHTLIHAQDIRTPQTSQGPPAPVVCPPSSSSSTQLLSLDRGGAVYVAGTRSVRHILESLTLDVANTGSMELLSAGAAQHSHPSPVATSPSNQNSAAGPSRLLPSSPERKRLFPSSADEEPSTARRVVPRSDRAWSVHSTSSDSHRRSHSTDVSGRGPLIPQDRYTTSSTPVYNTTEQHRHITFDLENPSQIGIPITDILNRTGSFDRMRDRTQAFNHMGKKTFTLRVQWPGYKPWSKTIAALDWKKLRAPITRVKLAEAVATAIRDMLQKNRDERCDPDYVEWNVGPNGIQLDQLCLVALYHVSKGSWQPQLCLLQPRQR